MPLLQILHVKWIHIISIIQPRKEKGHRFFYDIHISGQSESVHGEAISKEIQPSPVQVILNQQIVNEFCKQFIHQVYIWAHQSDIILRQLESESASSQ